MDVLLDLRDGGDRTARLYRHLLDGIATGRLQPGERLPATRSFAAELGVSRGTVAAAYDRLIAEGWLIGRVGDGTFVSADVASTGRRRAPVGEVRPRAEWSRLPAPVRDQPARGLDLTVGGPDVRTFPMAVWRRLVSATLRPSLRAVPAYDGSGHPQLQSLIAQHLGTARSVSAEGADVLLTGGAQQALDLVGRVMLSPGDVVAVEDPAYLAAVRLYASHGARICGVPVDEEGLVVDRLPPRARLGYVTPSHQYPTGAVLSLRRRVALLEWAEQHGAVIVEDDYDSEFRYASRPLAPLQSLDRSGRVIYVGSFSKTLLPLLRIGYLIAPQSLQEALRQAKLLSDWQGDAVTQGAMARFMAEGLLAAHLKRATKVYAGRRAALLGALEGVHGLRVLPSAAGLHVCAVLTDQRRSDRRLVEALAAHDVAVEPLSPRFLEQRPTQGLMLGIRHIDEQEIPLAIRRIGEVIGV